MTGLETRCFAIKQIATEYAVGHVLCHDMTQIIPGVTKDARFRKGHIVRPEDIPVLLSMGKETLYVWEKDDNAYHEDEAAEILRDLCLGPNMRATAPKEGKIEINAACDGLFTVDVDRLNRINDIDEVMIATRHTDTAVRKGDKLAGTRVIPLVIAKSRMALAAAAAGAGGPILKVRPFVLKTAGLVTTGNEIKKGLIQDRFSPVVIEKLAGYGIKVEARACPGDDMDEIAKAALEMKASGLDLILCTGGMSVDPDDRTPGAIQKTGAGIVAYGAPVLPGAMFLLGYFEDGTPILGLPGCVMYARATIFDLVLPRVAAGVRIDKKSLVAYGHGGLCLGCAECRYPVCPFGKAGL